MVQKKMAKTCNNLAANAIQPNKKQEQAIAKPTLQNHDGKAKVADLKAVKMKKSRPIKRCNVDISLQSSQPSPLVAPAHTPSPKKGLHCKSPYTTTTTSPNYMKSTSSSEARKERTSKLSSTSSSTSSSKLHKVAKTLSSSMKKMRSLTKAPSFKHTTRSGSGKKMALCRSDLNDVRKATCSTTLKDSKFPSYLQLEPGATEAEGKSVFKICSYNYCSLNGHHHVPAPPLKRFMSSRRRVLKTMKARIDEDSGGGGGEVEDLLVEVYVPDGEVITAEVSESLSDGLCSETEWDDDNLDRIEAGCLSGMNLSPESGEYSSTLIQKQTSFESLNDSLDGYFGENSDIEWEEGQTPATHDNCEFHYVQAEDHYSKDQDKGGFEVKNNASRYLEFSAVDQNEATGFELNNGVSGYVEFRTEDYSAYSHDEIVECLHFSDTDSMPDGESTHTGYKQIEELLMVKDDMGSEPNDEITNDSSTNGKFCTANNGDRAEIDHSGSGNGTDYWVSRRGENSEEEPIKVPLISHEEMNEVEVKTSDQKRTGLDTFNSGESSSELKLLDNSSSSKLKRVVSRCRKAEDNIVEDRELFNPRGPNFLAAERVPDAEKVDLRHQEMDDRRSAEEWMLDYALQKTVNQLAPARNRKVALLVEAFESVLPMPMPKFEARSSRISSAGFPAHSKTTIQACS